MDGTRPAPLLTMLSAPIVAACTSAGFWGAETIYHLAARHARTKPQAFAVRDRHRRLAAHFAGQGIRAGHRVGVHLTSRDPKNLRAFDSME
jgi:hypothetical protein